MKASITAVTDGQRKQIKRFAEDAVDRAIAEGILSKEGIQRLIENGDKFQDLVVNGIRELSISYAYPEDYKVKSITEQVAILRQLFPELKDATFDENIASQPLPPNAEGWFAIPEWWMLASTYGEAVEKVLAMIASKRKFRNYYNGKLGAKHLKQHHKTVEMFQKLSDEQRVNNQSCGILVVPAQFGFLYRGRSAYWAREAMGSQEFGIGAFAVGIMLLTHPEREAKDEQLDVCCAGDEFQPGEDDGFPYVPVFYSIYGIVNFDAEFFDIDYKHYGSASGFLLQ